MKFKFTDLLKCPHDESSLQLSGHSLKCAAGHSFDIAKQGYVNLLPVQQKRSKHPGDNAAMVAARSRFLNLGYYEKIAEHLSEITAALVNNSNCVIDAGCGEGYYLDYLQKSLREHVQTFIGFDISKQAIISACKRNRDITWLVASNKNPPLQPGCADLLLSLFGFPNPHTFSSLLKPGGYLITVDPGTNHLIELRNLLYPETNIKKRTNEESERHVSLTEYFERHDDQEMYYSVQLNQAALLDLAKMTPHYYRANEQGRRRLLQCDELWVTVDVRYTIYRPGLKRVPEFSCCHVL